MKKKVQQVKVVNQEAEDWRIKFLQQRSDYLALSEALDRESDENKKLRVERDGLNSQVNNLTVRLRTSKTVENRILSLTARAKAAEDMALKVIERVVEGRLENRVVETTQTLERSIG